jgi:hypothetical protein
MSLATRLSLSRRQDRHYQPLPQLFVNARADLSHGILGDRPRVTEDQFWGVAHVE